MYRKKIKIFKCTQCGFTEKIINRQCNEQNHIVITTDKNNAYYTNHTYTKKGPVSD